MKGAQCGSGPTGRGTVKLQHQEGRRAKRGTANHQRQLPVGGREAEPGAGIRQEGTPPAALAPVIALMLGVFALPHWVTRRPIRCLPGPRSRAARQFLTGAVAHAAWVGAVGTMVGFWAGRLAGALSVSGVVVLVLDGQGGGERAPSALPALRALCAFLRSPVEACAPLRRQRAAIVDVLDAARDWTYRPYSHVVLVFLLSLFPCSLSAQHEICDVLWLTGASDDQVLTRVGEGADPNATCNRDGDRPLHQALSAVPPSVEVIQALMSQGADVLVPNKFGQTPWELAQNMRVEALRQYDAKPTTTAEDTQTVRRTEAIHRIIRDHALDPFGNPKLGRPLTSLHPCHLTAHGRHYRAWFPGLPDLPLSHAGNLPVEFHMHHSIPRRYRPAVRAAAAEWNEAAGFHAVAIHSEIDHGDGRRRHIPDSKNVIYWMSEIGTESSPLHITAGATDIKSLDSSHGSFVLIDEVDIFIYEVATGLGLARELFVRSLRRAGVSIHPGEADIESLQRLWLEVLSNMSREHFRAWVIRLMQEKGIRLVEYDRGRVDDWIITAIDRRIGTVEPLRSFDDLRGWLMDGFSVDLEQLREHVDRNPLVKGYLLHEFGHALGLGHNPDAESLMHSGLEITPVPVTPRIRTPAKVDEVAVHGLACTYEVGSSTGAVTDRADLMQQIGR